MGPRHLAAFAIAFAAATLLGGCRPGIYDIDRLADPIDKARYSCQYLLERGLSTEAQRDADGVLRRRIADFAEPDIAQQGDSLHIAWPAGAITLRTDASPHYGACTMRLRPNGRFVETVTLDGAALHAGFGM